MKIYIDFDGTLFNTDKYTKDFMNIFNEYGIDKDTYDNVKKQLFNDENLFNLDVIVDFFIEKYNLNTEFKDKIFSLLNDSYLYSETIDCLDKLINSGYELYLLTYGDEDYQKKKIDGSNIAKYFKEIIITDNYKSKLNLEHKNSIFIDNNPNVIEELYNSMYKNIIRIKRDGDKYTEEECSVCDIIECNNFNEVVLYLTEDLKHE